jgi:hypothetical protein
LSDDARAAAAAAIVATAAEAEADAVGDAPAGAAVFRGLPVPTADGPGLSSARGLTVTLPYWKSFPYLL